MSARVVQVIEAVITRGRGTEDSPHRAVVQYWSLDGTLLAERDIERERRADSCRCPAARGEGCPLTTEQCAARVEKGGFSA